MSLWAISEMWTLRLGEVKSFLQDLPTLAWVQLGTWGWLRAECLPLCWRLNLLNSHRKHRHTCTHTGTHTTHMHGGQNAFESSR